MRSNPVQMFSSPSLGALADTGNALMRRPAAIIISALAAIALIGRDSPKPKPDPCHQIVLEEPELIGRYCTGSLDGTCKICDDDHLNVSLCEQLNDADWESLPLKDNFDYFKQRILFFPWLRCKAVEDKLNLKLVEDFRKVALNMGHPNPNTLSVATSGWEAMRGIMGITAIAAGHQLIFSPKDKAKWWNLEASQQRQHARGIFAHEIAHAILKHQNSTVSNEVEADLLSLRVPEYARGMRDDYSILLQRCEDLYNSTYCDMRFSGSTHPLLRHRVAYLTDALCEKYSGLNQDICQCNASDTTLTSSIEPAKNLHTKRSHFQ